MRWDGDGRMLDLADGLASLAKTAAGREDIDALWLFGSYGTDRQTPLSDIDFAVLPAPGTPRQFMWLFGLEAWLSEFLRCDAVDLLRIDTAPLWLQADVAQRGRLLFVREPIRFADYFEVLWSNWGDFQIDYHAFQAEARQALLQAVRNGH